VTDPDPLDQARLAAALTAGGGWRSVEVVDETGSTNADLAERARRGERAGLVLVTDHQVAGRGRLGRTWTAPAGSSVALSVLLRPEREPAAWTWLPLLAGLAVADGLRALAGVPAELKWPNDVLVDGAKICGILAERVDGPTGPACVLGLGVNVHLTAVQLPVPTATSLALLRPDHRVARTQVIIAVLAELAGLYRRWNEGGDAELAAAYVARSATIGRRVTVHGGDRTSTTGEAVGVDAAGRLRVRTPAGVQTFAAGDVHHLR
jgi:BirA family biotin operon repressor/biotin-[acetyl-CoA-carboxylase] ligase